MRPEITRAQIIASVAAGVPVAMNLLAAFGVFVPSPAEQHALSEATKWATGFAVLLVASDAHLRGKRNEADAAKATAQRTDAAAGMISSAARTIEKAANPVGSAEPGRGDVDFARSMGAGRVDQGVDLEGPGDADQMPHFVTSDPLGGRVPPDEVDLGAEAES